MTPSPTKKSPKSSSKTGATSGKGHFRAKKGASSQSEKSLPNHCNLCGLYIMTGESVHLFPCTHIVCFPCLLDHQAATKYHERLLCPKQSCQHPVSQYEYARRVAQHNGTLKLVPQPRRTIRFDSTKEWTTKKSTEALPNSATTAAPADTSAAISAAYPTLPSQPEGAPAEGVVATVGAGGAAEPMDATDMENHIENGTTEAAFGVSARIHRPPPPTQPTESATQSIRLQDLERMPRDMRRHLASLQSKVAKVLKTPHEPGKIPAFDVVAFFRTLAPVQSSAGGRPSKDAKIIARNLCMAYNEESLRNFLGCWITPEQAAVLPLPDDPSLEIIYGVQDDKVVFDSTVSRLNMGVREERLKDDDDSVSTGHEWED